MQNVILRFPVALGPFSTSFSSRSALISLSESILLSPFDSGTDLDETNRISRYDFLPRNIHFMDRKNKASRNSFLQCGKCCPRDGAQVKPDTHCRGYQDGTPPHPGLFYPTRPSRNQKGLRPVPKRGPENPFHVAPKLPLGRERKFFDRLVQDFPEKGLRKRRSVIFRSLHFQWFSTIENSGTSLYRTQSGEKLHFLPPYCPLSGRHLVLRCIEKTKLSKHPIRRSTMFEGPCTLWITWRSLVPNPVHGSLKGHDRALPRGFRDEYGTPRQARSPDGGFIHI
uniref:Uncharacterized protein n=1 Tax=Candidatus Kentrum sp. LFY TaxID=2126342 RepID=A0A450V1G3_9GAMM|nr:MAG: hypothetical protein BECKLFY1418A_GA0070994_10864 [Candidatus Kentron sp. LFY]